MLGRATVFDDVRAGPGVPAARGSPALALAFVEYHRFTAVSHKLPLLDLLVGSAASSPT
jgi:hypothetical protein